MQWHGTIACTGKKRCPALPLALTSDLSLRRREMCLTHNGVNCPLLCYVLLPKVQCLPLFLGIIKTYATFDRLLSLTEQRHLDN